MTNRQEIKVIVSNLHFSGLTFEYRVLEFCHIANERTIDLTLNRRWKPWRDFFDQLWETDMEYCTFWLPESDDFAQEKNSLNLHEEPFNNLSLESHLDYTNITDDETFYAEEPPLEFSIESDKTEIDPLNEILEFISLITELPAHKEIDGSFIEFGNTVLSLKVTKDAIDEISSTVTTFLWTYLSTPDAELKMLSAFCKRINEWLSQEKTWLIGCQGSNNKSTCQESISDLLSFVDNLLSKK
ncbi:MAG: hypothetical protein KAR35_00140 [Candidatus Heimdallarchaeota archaeon]|nr:hypothetical protein [Candidatus Heimdallarchaeota archaeon]MCK5047759.1 hypothetical protein [Candidatus Heimdallarchaeota archaeon]